MRTVTATAVLAGVLALGMSATVPAEAASTVPSPIAGTATASPSACPLDAKAAAKGASVIAEVVVRHPAAKAADGTTTLAVLVQRVLKGTAKKAPATLVVSGSGCSERLVQAARAGDVLLVLGTSHGTQLRVSGSVPAVLLDDRACEVERVLGKACGTASTGVVFTDLAPAQPQHWLRIAAPGLAAIIVSVLGLLLLRLRRR